MAAACIIFISHSIFQSSPLPMRKKYRLYFPTSLTNANLAVRDDNVSVRRASKQFDIPMQTLRDRVLGKVDPECVTIGRAPVFSMVEESHIVEHLKAVAKLVMATLDRRWLI